jgi:hypothetical protein
LALGLDHGARDASAPPAPAPTGPATENVPLQLAPQAASAPQPAARVVYNLNPFDQGATRDLKRPKAVEPPREPPPEDGR